MELKRIRARYQVTANDQDITAALAQRFLGLRLADESGTDSDTLEITLADQDPAQPVKIPPKGAELAVFIGWDADPLTPMGVFVCDEIELGGWPGTMTIRARGAIYKATPKGKTDLQSQKARSWPKGTKLGDLAAKIAKEHGMQPVVAQQLAAIVLPQFDQTEESDISFLLRVAKRYDAIVKPSGGTLVLAKRGASENASGGALPVVTITPDLVADWTYTASSREAPGTVIAYWHSTKASKKIQVQVGSGDPVKRLRHYYPTEDAATSAAQAELDRRTRAQVKFNCTVQGDPLLGADARLLLPAGLWREGVAGEWLVDRVEHVLDASGGYCCHLDAEIPQDKADEADTDEE